MGAGWTRKTNLMIYSRGFESLEVNEPRNWVHPCGQQLINQWCLCKEASKQFWTQKLRWVLRWQYSLDKYSQHQCWEGNTSWEQWKLQVWDSLRLCPMHLFLWLISMYSFPVIHVTVNIIAFIKFVSLSSELWNLRVVWGSTWISLVS